MTSVPDNSYLLSDQDVNQFLLYICKLICFLNILYIFNLTGIEAGNRKRRTNLILLDIWR